MSDLPNALVEQYTAALEDYLAGGGETALQDAYELGRTVMLNGMGVLDLAGIYHESLATVLLHKQASQESHLLVRTAADFYTASLSPFEMVQRGFQETNVLRRLNEELAQHVAQLPNTSPPPGGATRERERTEETLRSSYEKLSIRLQQRTTELARASEELRTQIAERRQVEQALRESEERFRATFEQAAVGIGHINLNEGRWLRVNQKFGDIVGYTSEELLDHLAFRDITHPDDLELDYPQLLKMLAGELKTYSVEKRYFRKDGSLIWVNNTVSLVRDANGEPQYFISVIEDITRRIQIEGELRALNVELEQRVQDRTVQLEATNRELTHEITERQRAEETIRESQQRIQAYLDHSPTIAFLKDFEGRYLLVNRRFEEFYHLNREQIVGKTDYDIFPQERADRFLENDRRILAALGTIETEITVPLEDGRHTYVLSMFALRDTTGQPYGLGGFCTDITPRKQAQEEVQELNEQLKLHSAQLEVTNRELEAFSYSVSHDLRAPLRSIDGFSQAFLEDYGNQLDEVGKSYLERVRTASQRMAQLIDDLLELSRVTRSEMRVEQVDLSALVRAIAVELHQAEPYRIMEWSIADAIIVEGDARLLRIALENLVGNAWKFTSKCGQARIEFGVTHREGRDTYFVRDNGAGFNPSYADKLFGAFQRLHSAADFPGTGIGLATVQRIVRRHSGEVWAESAVGQGATFFFAL